MSSYDVTLDHDLYPGDLVALEFLVAALAEEGDTTYGDTTVVGDFSFSTDAPLSTMRTEAEAFWTAGVADAGSATATVGFGSTTPYEYFDCFISDGTGTGTWQYATTSGGVSTITGRNFALALRGWYASSGYDAKATDVYTWLLDADSNTAYTTPAGTRNSTLFAGKTGDYDPTLALTTYIDVVAASTAVNRNGSDLYDWATLGLLAALRAGAASDMTEAKRQVSLYRRYAYSGVDDARMYRVSLRGKSGLSGQVSFTETILGASRRVYDALAAAMVGLVYREDPKIFVVRDHPALED